MSVAAIDTPVGIRCPHQASPGCDIYADRPQACRDFYCMWVRDVRGLFEDDHRPDRLGVIFTASKPDDHGRQVIYAHEMVPDAAGNDDARRVIRMLTRFATVHVLPAPIPIPDVTPLTLAGRPIDGQPTSTTRAAA